MKRRSRLNINPVQSSWMLSFTDLVMLLLALFVLIFSMSSMDIAVLERITASLNSRSVHNAFGPSRVDGRIRILAEMMMDRARLPEQEDLIKDLLFPEDILLKNLDNSTLKQNIRILARPDGIAIVIGDRLLFEEDSAKLSPAAREVILAFSPILRSTRANVLITGHSGEKKAEPVTADVRNSPGTPDAPGKPDTPEADELEEHGYILSSLRALAVLKVFLQDEAGAYRFAAAGYGPDRPLTEEEHMPGTDLNRRVEILIKPINARAPGTGPADGGPLPPVPVN